MIVQKCQGNNVEIACKVDIIGGCYVKNWTQVNTAIYWQAAIHLLHIHRNGRVIMWIILPGNYLLLLFIIIIIIVIS